MGKRVKHSERCKIDKSETSLAKYDVNLALECHRFYDRAPLPVLDSIFLVNVTLEAAYGLSAIKIYILCRLGAVLQPYYYTHY